MREVKRDENIYYFKPDAFQTVSGVNHHESVRGAFVVPAASRKIRRYPCWRYGGGYLDNPQYDAYLSMFELNDEKTEIVFLGDSITARGRFEEFFREKRVLNRGIGSDVSEGILNRLDEVLIHEPSQIFIMAGINDLSRGVALEDFRDNMDKIVKTINNSLPDTEVYLQSVLPVIDSKVSLDEICNANRELESVAQENGCSYVDLYGQFMDRNGDVISCYLSADGVHLTGAGYAAWVEAINEYIISE